MKFASNLNLKEHQFFLLTLYRISHKKRTPLNAIIAPECPEKWTLLKSTGPFKVLISILKAIVFEGHSGSIILLGHSNSNNS